MEAEWDWRSQKEKLLRFGTKEKSKKRNQKIKFKKEGKSYELWKIWWTICATRIKRKIK